MVWNSVVRHHGGAGTIVLTVLLTLLTLPVHAQEIRVATTAATLTIVVSPVEHVPSGTEARQTAADGMNLAEGDRVVTGHRAIALVTFLDGSTVTIHPGSDVVIARAAVATPESANLRILIRAGRVWARVARLLGRRSSISLESNEYAATAREPAHRRCGLASKHQTRPNQHSVASGAPRIVPPDSLVMSARPREPGLLVMSGQVRGESELLQIVEIERRSCVRRREPRVRVAPRALGE